MQKQGLKEWGREVEGTFVLSTPKNENGENVLATEKFYPEILQG